MISVFGHRNSVHLLVEIKLGRLLAEVIFARKKDYREPNVCWEEATERDVHFVTQLD